MSGDTTIKSRDARVGKNQNRWWSLAGQFVGDAAIVWMGKEEEEDQEQELQQMEKRKDDKPSNRAKKQYTRPDLTKSD